MFDPANYFASKGLDCVQGRPKHLHPHAMENITRAIGDAGSFLTRAVQVGVPSITGLFFFRSLIGFR